MAPTRLCPYLNFRGAAREAMDFYRSVFGGELSSSTFAEGGVPHDPAEADHIMHSQLETDSGLMLMASDVPSAMPSTPGTDHSVALSGDDEVQLHGYWDGLSDGATVDVALERAPWGDSFGMLTDRYGVKWLVNISGQASRP